MIGDYARPSVRLPGSGGACEIAINARRIFVIMPQTRRSFVERVDFVTSPGYLRGGDEETRYRCLEDSGDRAELEEESRQVWHQGDITALLSESGAASVAERSGCWHRVRNPGPGTGVSIHVLCLTPPDHPHRYWDKATGAVHPFPFVEAAPDRWRAEDELG